MTADREAFVGLYLRCIGDCRLLAARIVQDRASAEEIAAEAFTRAWARWSRVVRHPSPEGWVMRVCVNLAVDECRKRRRLASRLEAADAPDSIDGLVAHQVLVNALSRLPERQRIAVVLRYLADMSEADAADAMGVSAGAVKTHLHRGVAALRRSVGDDEVERRLGVA